MYRIIIIIIIIHFYNLSTVTQSSFLFLFGLPHLFLVDFCNAPRGFLDFFSPVFPLAPRFPRAPLLRFEVRIFPRISFLRVALLDFSRISFPLLPKPCCVSSAFPSLSLLCLYPLAFLRRCVGHPPPPAPHSSPVGHLRLRGHPAEPPQGARPTPGSPSQATRHSNIHL